MTEPLNILFVCARNQWRSPTAEQIYRQDPRFNVRSAGVNHAARHRLSQTDLEWADLVLAMERSHVRRIREQFRDLELPAIESLDIPDEFQFGDRELIELIRAGTEASLNSFET